ncbi:MAG: hypothetical protein F6K06_12560 [Okeania sp. SIO1H4]|nr:hypothetical protein [Okeania sp. SIO1H4]NET20225.1 hypothetical protein [Okeania sp. SIO1H5]NET95347.1 hypothetical protein [Okeania sp. SIO1H2]RQH14469.1 hypothetical protein D4Z78_22620 [Okeania hirsuta]
MPIPRSDIAVALTPPTPTLPNVAALFSLRRANPNPIEIAHQQPCRHLRKAPSSCQIYSVGDARDLFVGGQFRWCALIAVARSFPIMCSILGEKFAHTPTTMVYIRGTSEDLQRDV